MNLLFRLLSANGSHLRSQGLDHHFYRSYDLSALITCLTPGLAILYEVPVWWRDLTQKFIQWIQIVTVQNSIVGMTDADSHDKHK